MVAMVISVINRERPAVHEEEDYMGDLSQFLPPEETNTSDFLPEKIDTRTSPFRLSKKSKTSSSWKNSIKIERERQREEEDEQTIAKADVPISQSNVGFKLLRQMGYMPGSALGRAGLGITEPVGISIRRNRMGIGREDMYKEKKKQKEIEYKCRRSKEEVLIVEFGSRMKLHWHNRRVVINFNKAQSVLNQLENKELVEFDKENDKECEHDEEDEEQKIIEEDLHKLLMKLREEHLYCLFCGFTYETEESLSSSCPGVNEDDH